MSDSDEIADADLGPSKSQLKREAQALTKLGEQLVALEEKQLRQFPLDVLHEGTMAADEHHQQCFFAGEGVKADLASGDDIREIESWCRSSKLQHG